MVRTYLIGIGGIIILALGWGLVQWLWRRTFPDEISDEEDVLEIRGTCSNCGCSGVCRDTRKPLITKR